MLNFAPPFKKNSVELLKKTSKKYSFFLFVSLLSIFSSCVSHKDITYFQDLSSKEKDTVLVDRSVDSIASRLRTGSYEAKIQAGDILNISVTSINPEATALFSYQSVAKLGAVDPIANLQAPGFLVDSEGKIQFPVLGDVEVRGKSTREIKNMLVAELEKYLEKPVVSVRFSNFKITIIGDVTKPGVYTFPSERVTLFEALSSAGDLTIFASRKNVKLIREVNGKNQITFLDLTDKNILQSKNYYLNPNDMIYVQPGKGKIAAADNMYRILPMVLSVINIGALIFYRLGK